MSKLDQVFNNCKSYSYTTDKYLKQPTLFLFIPYLFIFIIVFMSFCDVYSPGTQLDFYLLLLFNQMLLRPPDWRALVGVFYSSHILKSQLRSGYR